jgi:hypothetical protein
MLSPSMNMLLPILLKYTPSHKSFRFVKTGYLLRFEQEILPNLENKA